MNLETENKISNNEKIEKININHTEKIDTTRIEKIDTTCIEKIDTTCIEKIDTTCIEKIDTTPVEKINNNQTEKLDNTDDDNNILSGDNKIDVDIKPDVKDNVVPIQVCSCSLNIIFNCFSK